MEKYIDGVSNLIPGKRYRIVHLSSTQRYPRESCMTYLGFAGLSRSLSFSARPAAGTQELPRTWIKQFQEVPVAEIPFVNHRYEGELL